MAQHAALSRLRPRVRIPSLPPEKDFLGYAEWLPRSYCVCHCQSLIFWGSGLRKSRQDLTIEHLGDSCPTNYEGRSAVRGRILGPPILACNITFDADDIVANADV